MECSICMDAIQGDKNISTTACGHTFHHQCLYTWHRRHTNCPLCRKEFGTSEEEEYGGYGRSIAQYVQQMLTLSATPFLIRPTRLDVDRVAARHYAELPLEDFTGEIEERDIELVMTQAEVSHETAHTYLRYYHGDIVDTLMYLLDHPHLPIPPFRRRIREPVPEPYEQKHVRDRVVSSRRIN